MTCLLWVSRTMLAVLVCLQECCRIFAEPLRTFEDSELLIVVQTPIVWDWLATLLYLAAALLDVVAWFARQHPWRRRLLLASLACTALYLLVTIRHGLNPGSFAISDAVATRAFPGLGVGYLGPINSTWAEWPFIRQLRLDPFFNLALLSALAGAGSALNAMRSRGSVWRMTSKSCLDLAWSPQVCWDCGPAIGCKLLRRPAR